MPEKEPTPILRGIEIRRERVEDIRKKASESYKRLVELNKTVENAIDTALSGAPTEAILYELSRLFAQKHSLEHLNHELEELILHAWDHRDQLHERWDALQQRLHSAGF